MLNLACSPHLPPRARSHCRIFYLDDFFSSPLEPKDSFLCPLLSWGSLGPVPQLLLEPSPAFSSQMSSASLRTHPGLKQFLPGFSSHSRHPSKHIHACHPKPLGKNTLSPQLSRLLRPRNSATSYPCS